MDQETQNKVREKIIASYQESAFEFLGKYAWNGERYNEMEKVLLKLIDSEKDINEKLFKLRASPDRKQHGKEILKLQQDASDYKKRIDSAKDLINKVFKEVTDARERGVKCLEFAEFMKTFKFKTPEEIEADKKATINFEGEKKS